MSKLVRDRIPEIIERNGDRVEIKLVEDDAEFDQLLREKLEEEVLEVQKAVSREELMEELADVVSVQEALCTLHGITRDELLAQQEKKDTERGGFEKRIFLISTENK